MADELTYVNPGDQILATQYNNLVDAVGGPSNPNSSAPFVKTPSGPISTAGFPYIPKEQNDSQTPLFSLMYSTDTLLSAVPGEANPVYSNPPEFFSGIWCYLGDEVNAQWVKHEANLPNSWKFVVDFTANSFRLIHYRNKRFPTGWVAISNVNKATFLCVFQVRGGGTQAVSSGATYSVIGDFSKCPNYDPEDPTQEPSQWMEESDLETIKQELKRYQHNITEDEYLVLLEDFRIYTPSEDILDYIDAQNPPPFFVPPLAENVGVQWVESYPDSNDNVLRHDIDGQYDTFLSSVQFTPSKYYSTSPMYGTWTYGLYNFSTLSSTSDDLSTIIDNNDLSSYDVVIKHKAPHPNPRQLEGLEDQCSAVVEYMPLSSLIGSSNHTGDANSAAHQLSSIYLSSDGQYELYNFHLSGTTGLTKYDWQYGLSNDIEVVVRDNTTPGQSKVNYIPKSWLSAVGGDRNVLDVRRSIEYVNNPDPYYQLYCFGDESFINLDPVGHHRAFEFVVRYHNAVSQREEIQYGRINLSALAQISGDANIMPDDQNSIITVSDGFGNVWHQLYGLGDTGVISAVMAYDNDDHYIMNEGNSWTNPNKQFLYYDYIEKRLKYGDICLYMPKVKAADLDDDVLPEISDVIIPEVSVMISAELSALDDRYWIKGEDETENYGSAIGDNNGNIAIDLNNKYLYNNSRVAISLNDYQLNGDTYDYWKTPNLSATRNITAGNQVTAPTIWATGSGATLKIGNTTLNESQLQQLLSLLNAPQRLQQL